MSCESECGSGRVTKAYQAERIGKTVTWGEMMENKSTKDLKSCTSCGGSLRKKDSYTYQCTSCGREYYVSADRVHKVSVHLSVGKIILICVAAVIAVTTVAVGGYQYYTGNLVESASRFSVAFRDFLMEAYGKPIAEISGEDLAQIKYLKIEKDGAYRFTYSFADYYDYGDMDSFSSTLQSIEVETSKDDFSPSNLQYFTGLTRVELYTGAWENYVLPQENELRCIYCTDGLSKYGTPQFFTAVNEETLEEVAIFDAEHLEDYSFLENLRGIRQFHLEGAVLGDVSDFAEMEKLEELSLRYVVMEEDETYHMVRDLLALPSLKEFSIEGKTAWYLTEAQWAELEAAYGERVTMRRE